MRTTRSPASQLNLALREPARRPRPARERVSRRELKQVIAQLLAMLDDEPRKKAS